ncbi:unnamed protein product [Plutella xylostella]|uniref:(diamondback moth) hypothetical protein n=1 Tax=Plutella xylostella TaxID=51655 RepID=A0A8S4G8V3_PLUXY|nr:unnamed protein product [Plutella xylostella]
MEDLVQRQKEIADLIDTILINFKKDPSSRKTADYIEQRIKKLTSLWAEFNNNNNELTSSEIKTDEYFTKNIFNKVSEKYNNIRTTLVEFSPHTMTKEEKSCLSKADELKNQQATNFRALLRVIKGIDIEALTEKWEMEDKIKMLESRWKVIDELHWQIDNILAGSDLSYESEFSKQEKLYEQTKRTLNRKLTASIHQFSATPQIEIPTFSGSYSTWTTFVDLYQGAIHNNPVLSKAQKMQHLKGKLKGEAERLVQHLCISSDNYDTCWEILTHRYDNKQSLFTHQIQIFMNQSPIQAQTAKALKNLHDISMETIHAIQNLGIDTLSWDPILVHIVTEKLDPDTYASYMETRKAPRELPTFDELMDFLESKFVALEPLTSKKISTTKQQQQQAKESTPKSSTFNFQQHGRTKNFQSKGVYHTKQGRHCPLCKNEHILFHCEQFTSMAPETKCRTISQLNVCKNCLYCHGNKQCNSTKRCKECNGQHNTSLHEIYHLTPEKPKLTNKPTTSSQRNTNHVAGEFDVLLATVQVKVMSSNGTYIQMRALLDQGSQVSLITENAAQRLGLPRKHMNATVSGVGTVSNHSRGVVQLFCSSLYDDYTISTEALVMTKVLNNLPNSTFERRPWSHVQNLQLADPEYNISRPVDILLDASVYSEIVMDCILRGSLQAPIAQQTKIGWILYGNVKTFNCNAVVNNIEDIAQFWEMEEITQSSTSNATPA